MKQLKIKIKNDDATKEGAPNAEGSTERTANQSTLKNTIPDKVPSFYEKDVEKFMLKKQQNK